MGGAGLPRCLAHTPSAAHSRNLCSWNHLQPSPPPGEKTRAVITTALGAAGSPWALQDLCEQSRATLCTHLGGTSPHIPVPPGAKPHAHHHVPFQGRRLACGAVLCLLPGRVTSERSPSIPVHQVVPSPRAMPGHGGCRLLGAIPTPLLCCYYSFLFRGSSLGKDSHTVVFTAQLDLSALP